jgi:uncharacterized membrane protein YgdD (TMEM256/DUF423 family)
MLGTTTTSLMGMQLEKSIFTGTLAPFGNKSILDGFTLMFWQRALDTYNFKKGK